MPPREAFLAAVAAAARAGSLHGLTLAKPQPGSVRTTVRPVTVAGRPLFQREWRDGPQTRHENLTADQLADRLAADVPGRFRHAHAFLADADLALLVGKKGKATLQRKRPSRGRPAEEQTPDAAPAAHDNARQYLIPEGTPCPFLAAAGVMLPDGRVPKAQRRKFRQINRFLELVDDVVDRLPADGTLRVVDFGSGKSHLTFALHHLLTVIRGRTVDLLSIDRNASVVDAAAASARTLGLVGVRHRAASIADVDLAAEFPDAADGESVHLAVWLHACDTATDDAIARSVRAGVRVILAVPCCQHELNAAITSDSLLFGHGLLRERAAAIATDALRAAALDRLGYRTQVLEFIDLQHTAKNVLIRSVRRSTPAPSDPAPYHALKQSLGLSTWHLETLLPELAES